MDLDEKSRILIVDDDPDLRVVICMSLEGVNCEILEAGDGREGLALAFTERPDLILLDREMPVMGGLEMLGRLRSNVLTRHIPVIMVTSLGQIEERVEGLREGSDDYVVKPFEPEELKARVQGQLRRARGVLTVDPLTKLPGNMALREDLTRRMEEGEEFSYAYLDLNHFKAYVDHCGFERASLVIQNMGRLAYNTLVDDGAPEDFIGHIGGDDFMLLASPERIGPLCQTILDGFDSRVPGWYDEEDAARGWIEGVDRYGTARRFPLVSLAAAVIDVRPGDFRDLEELGEFASRCKAAVKSRGGSVMERYSRRDGPPSDSGEDPR